MKKARLISIKAKHRALSLTEGLHKTFILGEEDDLKSIREYTYGDDIRKISWIITAKEKKPYVVEREELRSQNIIIVLLLDQDMLFKNKLEKVAEIYGLLGYSILYQKDKLNTYIITEKVEYFMKHKNTPLIVENSIEKIMNLDLEKTTLNPSKLTEIILRHKRSLVILIGDFFYSVNLLQISKKHKLAIIKVRDREEENPEKYEKFQLKSFDRKKKIPYLRKDMIKTYKKNLRDIDENLRIFISNKRIPHTKIYTDEDPYIKLKIMFS
ncbi:DUF58 domain-containing protein [Persephonella sp.]